MFFFNLSPHFVKTIFFTKINLAIIEIILPTINSFDRVKSDVFATFRLNLNLSLSYDFFYLVKKIELTLNSFYDIKRIESLLESFSFFLLLVTVFIYWFETAFHSKADSLAKQEKGQQFASLMVKLSNLSLTFLLGVRWITSHHFPLSNLYESLIFLSWSLTIIHLILEKTSHTLLIGVLLSPITLFINGFALFTLPAEMQKGNFLTPALQSNWLMMHVTVMISSYAALLSGSILAIAFLIITRDFDKVKIKTTKNSKLTVQNKMNPLFLQGENAGAASNSEGPFFDRTTEKNYKNLAFIEERDQIPLDPKLALQETPFSQDENSFLQKKKTESNFFLPKTLFVDLQGKSKEKEVLQNKKNLAKTLDNLSYRTIGIGFPLLTIGILSGAVWANEAWGSYWSWDPKETWALITWFLFAIYLHTRITKGLQGEKPAIIATIGFIVVWICFLGVNLASQGLHTYGWLQ